MMGRRQTEGLCPLALLIAPDRAPVHSSGSDRHGAEGATNPSNDRASRAKFLSTEEHGISHGDVKRHRSSEPESAGNTIGSAVQNGVTEIPQHP